nr:PREDICTED: G-protein coupled receptor 98 [Latimeria chalumnae]|eukprot:XP_014349406.1 PREDICTED: G-protein coupled receptor 98 [Latimeria chalumnae]
MPSASLLAQLLLALSITFALGETEVSFTGETEFVVNETSTSIVRLVIERTGVPLDITALVLLQGNDTGDFEATSAAARILSADTNQTVYIGVREDEIPEADETFVFHLQLQDAPENVTLGFPRTATVTILSNDNAFGIISFNMSSLITVNEPRGSSQFVPLILIREKGTYGTVTVNFQIKDGPNPADEDLSPAKGNITLLPRNVVVIYNLLILDDQIPENNEVFTVELTSVEGGAEINTTRNTVQIQINKNDSPLRFKQAFYMVSEEAGVIEIPVTRGKDAEGIIIGSDDFSISISYEIITENSTASAQLESDFWDLQPNSTIVFPPRVYESSLRLKIINDDIPEIAESFQITLLEDTLQGDGVLMSPSTVHVTIEPNDKPYGVLSVNSGLLASPVIIDEDLISRFEGISIVRNGGTHGRVSVNWIIARNSSDPSAVTADLTPTSGTLNFSQGQVSAAVPLNITSDDLPEEAEVYLFRLLANTVQGGAEVGEPTELFFYIRDSDDIYGLIKFHPIEDQKIVSSPAGRFLSLSFARQKGSVGDVRMNFTALYIPAGALDPSRARDGVLNVTRRNSVFFRAGQANITVTLTIRNDAFLQNGAHFLVQLDTVELVDIIPPIPSVSPRLGEIQNISLKVTPDIANGEIGFTSNQTLTVFEPENSTESMVAVNLQRDGTDGEAVVFWSLTPTGLNQRYITNDDVSPLQGSVTFLSGQSNATISITVKADDAPELNETLILSLDRSSVENQILKSGFTSRKIVILENDDPGGVFEYSPFSRGPYVVTEGEAVILRIVRLRGALQKQFLRYSVEPSGTREFYGSTGVLEFNPGEREIVITLLPKQDGIPELDESYLVVLSSHSSPPSKLGAATQVNITVVKNDDPYGVIQFLTAGQTRLINESKGDDVYAADYTLVRNQGTFGNVSASWKIEPAFTNDIYPFQGTIFFRSEEVFKTITVYSLPDEIPEELEVFSITLMNTTGGARLGNVLNATLQILKNDNPVYFADPVAVRVQEGAVANFTVFRNGSTHLAVTVMYATVNGDATDVDEDFIPSSSDNLLVFEAGEQLKNISVAVNEDDTPETDESFYIVLFNSTGDTVVYGADRATIIIEANDDPNGIFSLEQIDRTVEEGSSNDFMILRDRGRFGNVSVSWQLFANDSVLEPGQEFNETSGAVLFMDGEQAKPITLWALPDKIPEFIEVYVLKLANVSGGYPGPGGQLADTNLSVTVAIPFNDDPFGVFIIDLESQDREIAEDVLSEDDMSNVSNITVVREQGTIRDVRVGWEILSSAFRNGLPPMTDFLLLGSFPPSVESRPHMRRHYTGTDALYFSGAKDAYGIVSSEYHPTFNNTLSNFTFSAWVIPNANTDGFIITKDNGNSTLYYGVRIQTNESYVTMMLYYTPVWFNVTQVTKVAVLKFLEENVWVHLLITLDDGIIEFYLDGSPVPGGLKSLKGEAITDGAGVLTVGAGPSGTNRFTGLMQDVRIYRQRLNRAEIHEIHATPARVDLHPVSGYLEYRQGESRKTFIVSSKDDKEEEGEELFTLKLVSVRGGARISEDNSLARIRIQKSDNANGLFGFTGACIPESSDEGSTISCVVERTRGALDYVYVNYIISQMNSSGLSYNVSDFANSSGTITFLPWQTSEVLNLEVLDDAIPEFAEHFRVALVSATPGDGKPGSTPTSGASIDPEKATTIVTIKASDHPYGLLQFSVGPLPGPDVGMIHPASSVPSITVKEEMEEVKLLVVRAQGLLGTVQVEYRTISMTATSPEDYQETVGILKFLPGERYQYVLVNLTDDSVPELAKSFKVELLNAEGAVDELFRSDGSGSGDDTLEFLLPAVHQSASLGIASHIIVTIAASDDAHGVFQFSSDSLNVSGTEPEGGHGIVLMQVLREHGALSQVVVFWEVESDPMNDLIGNYGNITFEVGQTAANIMVRISSDDIPELDQVFFIRITNVSNGRLGPLTNATLTVLANDDPYGLLTFSERNRPIYVSEGNENITLTITRTKGLMGIIQVTYGTVNDNDRSPYLPFTVARASQGLDYIAIEGSVVFPANNSEATIVLPILDDADPERAESVFIQLLSVDLLEGVQERQIVDSPQLGPKSDIIAHVIINASDDAFGMLQLSAPAVRVPEKYLGPIINVTRTGGIFADVSVKFRAVPMTARVGEDFSVASSDVLLLEGESSKAVPIYIIDDIFPEIEETFRVELLNQTTGGAILGLLTQAIITIDASDDPYGSFVFQGMTFTVEEPDLNSAKISLLIVRNAGTLGSVTVGWMATVNGQIASNDLRAASGNVTFEHGETLQTLQIEVLADDVPEIQEVILVELLHASNGGSIGKERVVNILVPANDNPYGTVYFRQSVYRVQEPLEGSSVTNISVRRSGGRYGKLKLSYRTSEIDVVDLAVKEGQDIMLYYNLPTQGIPNSPSRTEVNTSTARDPLQTCAAMCLKERVCAAFMFSNSSGVPRCYWVTSLASGLSNNSEFLTFTKNLTTASSLLGTQAIAGSDYESVTDQSAIMLEGEEFANLTVSILTDSLPEVDERFAIALLRVELVNATASVKNRPSIGQPNASTVVIAMNGDAFGVFLIYSTSPNATDKGLSLEVREQPQTTVQLVIERRGGSLGQVTVEWRVVGGTATRNLDFIEDGEVLTFKEGEMRKTITLTILDDTEPEDNETIVISLTSTEGGSRILPSSDTVTVTILANDNVAGVVNFQTASRSVIGREGDLLQFHVTRTPPGRGNVTVEWTILGRHVQLNFGNFTGVLFFPEGSLNATISVNLLDDQIPEEKEEYTVILSNIMTQGVLPTGIAVLDSQGYEAVLTVEASDEPHGVLSFAPSSRMVSTQEGNKTIQLFVNREFGSLRAINITYETVQGSITPLNLTEGSLAEPGLDYIPVYGSVLLQEGETSLAINITILEDDIPELQEFFLVNLTSVELITYVATLFPPRLDAEGFVAQVTVDPNDGVRGVIEWESTDFELNETHRTLTLVAFRDRGTYGNVSLFFYPQNLEAQLGLDFNVTAMTLSFMDGERNKYIDIVIFDDDIPEGDEKFQLILANPSFGLELGQKTLATVTILANDDGHGILSFNNSEHFFLKEPTALSLSESVATLYIVRDPPQGMFGIVTVQYVITDINGSDASQDLSPSQGFVVLEDGVRFRTLEISAILDEEPEMDEQFIVTLSNPTGGARLGPRIQTMITVLQNQAPLGLFSIFPVTNRTSSVTVEEGNRTVYLRVSRSNGLNSSVSVEWETQSDTALGMKGDNQVLSVHQSFPEEPASGWCFFSSGKRLYGVLLRMPPDTASSEGTMTLSQWQGVFVPIQEFKMQNPKTCITFVLDGTSYIVIIHGGAEERNLSNITVSAFTPDTGMHQVQVLTVPESNNVRHFSLENRSYLIVANQKENPGNSQVFRWDGNMFVSHQSLPTHEATGLALFARGSVLHLAVSQGTSNQGSVIYQWIDGQFKNPQALPVNRTTQVEALMLGADVYLLFATTNNGYSASCEVYVWKTGQSSITYVQSLQLSTISRISSFTPPSGLVHALLAGKNKSALYSWNSEGSQFSLVLEAPSANELVPVSVSSLNKTRTLIGLAGQPYSQIYELVSISNQSDFILSSGELIFEPDDQELVIAINIIDDEVPEQEESFTVRLTNPKGGAEVGFNGRVTVVVPPNDDAYGIIAVAQNSLVLQVEEMERDNTITLSIERLKGTYGQVTVRWSADGSTSDIFPTSGVVTFSEGQVLSTISLTVLADDIPEVAETVTVTLTDVTTFGVLQPAKGAVIDGIRRKAMLTILANDSPYGVVGWHMDSLVVLVQEPEVTAINVTLTIVREQGFAGDVSIHYETRPNLSLQPVNQAQENKDYIAKDIAVILQENTAEASVTITVLPDDIPELQEGFLVNITDVKLVNSSAGQGQPSVKRTGMEVAEVTIEENDDPRGIIQFSVIKDATGATSGFEVEPPNNILRLPVIREAGRFGVVSVLWEARPVTASLEDFTPAYGNLTFADGQDSKAIEITIVDDSIVEFMETFSVALTEVVGGAKLGDEALITVIIPPNDSPVGVFGFEEKMATVQESVSPDDPAGLVSLTVVRSPGGKGAVQIIWLVEDSARDDVTPMNGTLHFNETEIRKTIELRAVQDAVLEGDESYTIQLLAPNNNADISPVDGSATIIVLGDGEAAGTVGVAPSSRQVLIGEPMGKYNGTAIISIVRGPGIFGAITVYWNITPPSMNTFTETSGILIMEDRQSAATILIQALDDDVPEEKRYYQLQLISITGGAGINESSGFANITVAASDFPLGHFTFSRDLLQTAEEAGQVNITVVRSGGGIGRVQLQYETSNSTAVGGADFTSAFGKLIFEPDEVNGMIFIEIHDDDTPEGPEEFFVNITKVEQLGSGYDFAVRENGLQLDQPPTIGNISSVRIVIQKSDNAEGVIEFDPQFLALCVEEDVGMLLIPVLRKGGTYGLVTASFISHGISASPGGIDYSVPNTSVTFYHGQNQSYINVSIIDDSEREYEEQFELQLTGATGGAALGAYLVTTVTIAKSDSPNGLFRFLNQTRIVIPNPNTTRFLTLVLERSGGFLGDAEIRWNILGPNTKESLPSINTDIGDPVNGSFHFGNGEGGTRTIELEIFPHGEIEVQETFIIKLSLMMGDSEIDTRAGNVTLIIENFGDPNGIVQFAPESISKRNYTEPSGLEGPLNITFLVIRVEGMIGDVMVFWKLQSDSDISGDFVSTSGFVTIPDMQRNAEVVIQLLPDDTPELDEVYTVQLVSVEGGATLDKRSRFSNFTVYANDDPHGVFAIYPDGQTVIVERDLSRHIQINVTRHAGTFGDVMVDYKISYDLQSQGSIVERAVGSLLVRDGANYGMSTVPILKQVFLKAGFNFSVELSNVSLVGGDGRNAPQILREGTSSILSIPEVAANSEVGFDSLAIWISNVTVGTSQAVISRRGLYGSVTVDWSSGYPPGHVLQALPPGNITPAFGAVMFSHGEKSKFVPLTVHASVSKAEAFAVHLTAARSSAPGGATLRSGFAVAEIEPMGIFQFAPDTRHVIIEEDAQTVTLIVQRLFGFRGNRSKVTYHTTAGSAKPIEDYEPIQNGELYFKTHQTEAIINVSVINDNAFENDETFYLNLSSVQALDFPPSSLEPRLNTDFSVALVTILANDIINGILSLGPTLIYTEEDTNNSLPNFVVLRVRRTMGFTGGVSATVKMFGGVSAENGLAGTPFETSHLNNLTWALEGMDFEEQVILVTLLDGETETTVSVRILDDDDPEGEEVFYVYLTDPQGGAQIVTEADDNEFGAFAAIIILGNDLQNGIVGFSVQTLNGSVLDEDSEDRQVRLTVERQQNRAFEDVTISWRATFNKTSVVLEKNGVDLVKELLAVLGTTTCIAGQIKCTFNIELRPDKVPELASWFWVEIHAVSAGAMINNSARFVNLTVAESDSPRGLIYFAVQSRLPAVLQKAVSLILEVVRESSTLSSVSVNYSTQELSKPEPVGNILIYPAVAGMDFVKAEGVLTFTSSERDSFLEITLTPELTSSNQLPKRFQVVLFGPTGGARVDEKYSTANITIVSDRESQSIWGLVDQLHQPLDDNLLQRVLQNLSGKVVMETTGEQLGAVISILEKVMTEAEKRAISDVNRNLFYDILCALVKPGRNDTKGFSQLAEVAERFAFSLLTDTQCGSSGDGSKKILDNCSYITIQAHHLYPQQINGKRFEGKNGDFFQVPEQLLDVPVIFSNGAGDNSCEYVQFTEYSSQHWFLSNNTVTAFNSKIFSVSLKGRGSRPLVGSEVTYRINSVDKRIIPHKSLCLLWNQTAESWSSDNQFCHVVNDTANYVDCACSHLSLYAVYAQTEYAWTDKLFSYNKASYSAGFICISGFTLAILSHLFCSKFPMFAAKLLIHMMVACLGTQFFSTKAFL